MCVTWLIRTCDMTHLYVWHDSFICVTWLIYMCHLTYSGACHDSFICVTWFIHVCHESSICAMTHFISDVEYSICGPQVVTWLNHTRDMTHSSAYHETILGVIWLIQMCAMIHDWLDVEYTPPMTRSSAWQPNRMCSMTQSYTWHDFWMCVAWLNNTRNMADLWLDSIECASWLTDSKITSGHVQRQTDRQKDRETHQCTSVRKHKHICVSVSLCLCAFTCIYVFNIYVIYVCIYIYIYMYIMYMYIYIHMYIYI